MGIKGVVGGAVEAGGGWGSQGGDSRGGRLLQQGEP